MTIVALAGGVGGAKLAEGLQGLVGPRLTVIGNVADDEEIFGLHISPDLDTVMYWLAGVNDETRGWGLADETWHCYETLEAIGSEPWFRLGDRDLATHLTRSSLLERGVRLTEVTARLTRGWGVEARLLPVTDDRFRTFLETDEGTLSFQDYFVRRRWQPVVREVRFEGEARATPEVVEAIERATAIVICPSNPFVSIDPLLAVEPLRERLIATDAPVVAVSPIVGGRAIKGPAAKLFRELGERPSATAVARRYRGLIDGFVLDVRDTKESHAIERLGVRVERADTLMTSPLDRRRVARVALDLAAAIGRGT